MSYSLARKSGGKSGPIPGSPDSRAPTRKDFDRILQVSMILLILGLVGLLVACVAYRPLYSGPIHMIGLSLFIVPMGFYFVSLFRKRAAEQVYLLRRIFRWSSGLLIAFVGLLIANGAFDHLPPQQIQSVVVRKYVTRGRRSTTYHLGVRSWRASHSDEDLQVGSRTFSALAEGQRVSVELHPGYLGVPWYGRIIPL